eukprot:5319514-Amphidinium_carterae.1
MPEKLGGGMSSKGTWILAVKVRLAWIAHLTFYLRLCNILSALVSTHAPIISHFTSFHWSHAKVESNINETDDHSECDQIGQQRVT